jgi:GH15 family glucan-1,4-alpha-glucosidase
MSMNARRDATTPVSIADYALLGDTRTAALVSRGGAVDWMCTPRFDSEPIFSRLVGGGEGGSFVVRPAQPGARVLYRAYRSGSAVLETTWRVDQATVTVTDGFVADVSQQLFPSSLLVRTVRAAGATVDVSITFDPRVGERRARPRSARRGAATVCSHGALAIALCTSAGALEPHVTHRVHVEPGRPFVLSVAIADREPLVFVPPEAAAGALAQTDRRWRAWSEALPDLGPMHDAVLRSLLTLRLLTYAPSGAPVAAPTTSLPELLGGIRNWDYRYSWPRDASLGIAAFLGVDCPHEAEAFMYWLLHAGRLERPRLPVVLTVDGRPVPPERELDGWPGFCSSTPVRVGNGARDQHQLDVYGWVLEAGHRLERSGHRLFAETWRLLADYTDYVAAHAPQPDAGIWEMRGQPRHYVHSKAMAWVALDDALRLAQVHRTTERRLRRWTAARNELRRSVTTRGFDVRRNTYVRGFDHTGVDAALAVLPILGFEDAGSPRVQGTLRAIQSELTAGPALFYRYDPGDDGIPGSEGAFLACSFWVAHAHALGGDIERSAAMLETLQHHGGELGLFPEEVDPSTGDPLGNYPQALSHSTFVGAALALRDGSAHHGRNSIPSAAP